MIDQEQQTVYELQAEVIKAVAHPVRIAIVNFLQGREQCVCDIVTHVGAQRSNVSRHLAVMVNAGVLSFRKEGLKVIYELETCCMLEFLACVAKVVDQRTARRHRLSRAV
ncbi:MAG: winged helix-turn-helix transcriptional regulator [Planctomycetes bacterium]|nr:winged helix-turn-helix transcriptional regulator [Planctomycetota bacterium]